MMQSVNFAVLGEQSVADGLGKKGTVTDITLYDRKESGIIRTYVLPNGFPEKIQPLFQAINLSEYTILHVSSLDKFAGEQIVALDVLQKRKGILSHSYKVDEGRLDSMIKETVLEQYKLVEFDKIKETADKLEPVSYAGKTRIVIDHCFDVKGVGTVVLGKVTAGRVKQYQNLKVLPSGAEVMVKSIQMHDDPVEEAVSPARVGLSLKGVKPDAIGRGDMLCEGSGPLVVTDVELDFEKSPFYKGGFAEDQTCLASIGLQIKPVRLVRVGSTTKISFDRPTICDMQDRVVLLKPESETIRIIGGGTAKL